MKITVLSGDVTQIACDALITTVNSSKLWYGALDDLISKYAGLEVHSKLSLLVDNLHESEAVNIRCPVTNRAKFKNVIFVIDDLNYELWELIYNALQEAEFQQFNTVAIPTLRYGVMKGIKEHNITEYVSQYYEGINKWCTYRSRGNNIQSINIVVYHDEELLATLKREFENTAR